MQGQCPACSRAHILTGEAVQAWSTDTPGPSCGAAEVLLFALVANTSIASLNLSLLVNSVGFYQARLQRVLKPVGVVLQHSTVAIHLMPHCQSCSSMNAVQFVCCAGPAALTMPVPAASNDIRLHSSRVSATPEHPAGPRHSHMLAILCHRHMSARSYFTKPHDPGRAPLLAMPVCSTAPC